MKKFDSKATCKNCCHKHSAIAKKKAEKRRVKVVWHLGPAGSGKSHSYVDLIERYGRDKVFKLNTVFTHGMFDGYHGQKVIFIDDFIGEIYPAKFLRILDGSEVALEGRHVTPVASWSEVHVASCFHPLEIVQRWGIKDDNVLFEMEKNIDAFRYHFRIGPLGSNDSDDYGFVEVPVLFDIEVHREIVNKLCLLNEFGDDDF